MVDTTVLIQEDCLLDEILNELPNTVAKPTRDLKGKNLTKLFHQIGESLKDVHLVYTCVDASSIAIALGTNVGNAYIYQRQYKRIEKVSSETKYVPTTCIKLGVGCATVAFGHESGTFTVGMLDQPIHQSFDSLTAQDVHTAAITCLEWSADGIILYAGDGKGKISMTVVKISQGILQTAIILEEDCAVVQLSHAVDALLISTTKRTAIWPFQNERLVQVGEKERKTSGNFGCCFVPDNLQEPSRKLYAARPGLRIWTADSGGKVSSTLEFKTLLADKPPVIRTMTGNDGRMNTGGQFGKILVYHNRYITTWDPSHLWVLDVLLGCVIGCHSNLGKVRDVAVSGHEIFVLLNQRERFLRRFTMIIERKPATSALDAVIAKPGYVSAEASRAQPPGDVSERNIYAMGPALISVPFKATKVSNEEDLEREHRIEDKTSEMRIEDNDRKVEMTGRADDVFQRINSIPLDEVEDDIVFAGGKKKKKKKAQKPSAEVQAPGMLSERPSVTTPSANATSFYERRDEIIQPKEAPRVSATKISVANEESSVESVTVTQSIPVLAGVTRDGGKTNILTSSAGNDQIFESKKEQVPRNQFLEEINKTGQQSHVTGSVPEEGNKNEKQHDGKTAGSIVTRDITMDNDAAVYHEESSHATTLSDMETSIEANISERKEVRGNEVEAVHDSTPPKEHKNRSLISLDKMIEPIDIYTPVDNISNYLGNDLYDNNKPRSLDEAVEDDKKTPITSEYHVPLLADTWSKRELPTAQTIEHLCITQTCIFCVSNDGKVFFSDPNTASCHGWEVVDLQAKQIFANAAGSFICYLSKDNKAFVRANVDKMSPVGDTSYKILDDASLISTCSVCTWALTSRKSLKWVDSNVLSKLKRDLQNSSIWEHEDVADKLSQIACFNNTLWGRTGYDKLLVLPGKSCEKRQWKEDEKSAKWLSISDDGTVWIITTADEIWFKPCVTKSSPTWELWYQITLGEYIIDDSSILDSTVNFFYSVGSAYRSSRTTEYLRHAARGFFHSTKDMACSLVRVGGTPKQVYCNNESGVWLLDTKNALHACRGQATGTYWEMVCPTGTARSATWRYVSAGLSGFVWALQPNGDSTCFHAQGPAYNVESPTSHDSIDRISASPHGLWCFANAKNTKIYIRDGISESYPQGFAWTSLSLHKQGISGMRHLSVGRITVWAVDNAGDVWIRVGTVDGDESEVRSQAWLPVDHTKTSEFSSVEVNAKDSMVWAIDCKGNVYAREGVDENFLVGKEWRLVSGVTLNSICVSSGLVYGITTTGEIVCRFGMSRSNSIGDYWKKISGSFTQIAVNSAGELWAVNDEGKLFARKINCLSFSHSVGKERKADKETKEIVDEDDGDGNIDDVHGDDDEGDWEVI